MIIQEKSGSDELHEDSVLVFTRVQIARAVCIFIFKSKRVGRGKDIIMMSLPSFAVCL